MEITEAVIEAQYKEIDEKLSEHMDKFGIDINNSDMKRVGKFYVYIVECRDGTYYTGYTPDIAMRIKLHNAGRGAKYTRDRRPVKLVWSKEYKYFKPAFLEEKMIKQLTRKQKEKLVSNYDIQMS